MVVASRNASEKDGLDTFQPKRQNAELLDDIRADGIVPRSSKRWSKTANTVEAVGEFKRRGSQTQGKPASAHQGGSNSGSKNVAKAPPIGANANLGFAKTIDTSAKRITAAVHSLYKGAKDGDDSKRRTHSGSRRPSVLGADGADGKRRSLLGFPSDDDGRTSANSDSSGTESDSNKKKRKDRDLDDDEDYQSDDEYDFKHAALKVTSLLDSLNCDERLNLMSELNSFYATRRGAVEDDLKDLGVLEDEFAEREAQTKNSMQSMLSTFEDKQMREVKVLVKCNKTLHLGAIGGLKKRNRFAKQGSIHSEKSRKSSPSSPTSPTSPSSPKSLKSQRKMLVARFSDELKAGDGPISGLDAQRDSKEEGSSEGDYGSDDEFGFDAQEEEKRIQAEEEKRAEEKKKLDGLDVEAAKRKLKEMQEAPSKVLMFVNQDAPPAAEILQALAHVQDGQVMLEHQAELAKKALEISKAAVEHLLEGTENPSNAVLELIEEIRFGIFGENGEELTAGPDPDELEEECKMLEALIAKQETEIDALNKQRERSNRLEQEVNEAHLDDAKSDDEEQGPALQKSVVSDGRIEAARSGKLGKTPSGQVNKDASNMSEASSETNGQAALGRVKTAMKMENLMTRMAPGDKTSDDASKQVEHHTSAIGTVPSWQSSRQIQMLQGKIEENTTKIAKARDLHKQMKKEYALLKYCAKMSDAGLYAILETFNPEDAGGESESDVDSSDDGKTAIKDKEITMGKTGSEPVVSSDALDGTSKKKDSAKKRRASAGTMGSGNGNDGAKSTDSPKSPSSPKRQKSFKKSPTLKESSMVLADDTSKRPAPKRSATAPLSPKQANQTGKDEEEAEAPVGRSKRGRMDYKELQGQVAEFNYRKLEEAEEELQTRIAELQAEIANDSKLIKGEKKKQVGLKKELTKVKKQFASMARQNKGIPTSLDALDQQMAAYTEGESKIQEQIEELRQELSKQQRLLAKAKAEAEETEERRRQSTAPNPRASQAQLVSEQRQSQILPVVSEKDAMVAVSQSSEQRVRPSALSVGSLSESPVTGLVTPPPPIQPSNASPTQTTTTSDPEVRLTLESTRRSQLDGIASESDQDRNSQTQRSTLVPVASRVSTLGNVAPRVSTLGNMALPPAPVPAASTVSHEDLNELVRLQSRNEELKSEIDDMMGKMKQLRNAMKKGRGAGLDSELIRSIVGGAKEQADAKPPPEYGSLKKELRGKQSEVRALRKQWWEDHKDLDMLAERVKLNLQYESMSQGQVAKSMEQPIQSESAVRASIEKTELIRQMTSELRRTDTSELRRGMTSELRRTDTSELRRGNTSDLRHGSETSNQQNVFSFEELGRPSIDGGQSRQRSTTSNGLEALMAAPTLVGASHTKDALRTRAATWAAKELPKELEEDDDHVRRQSDLFARFAGVRKSLGLPHHTMKDLLADDVDIHDRTVPEFKPHDGQESFNPLNYKPEFGSPSRKSGGALGRGDSGALKRAGTFPGFTGN